MAKYNEGENGYHRRQTPISAFQWDGNTHDAHSIPSWVKAISRDATLNEATDPPGLIVETLAFGTIKVAHGNWFVYDGETRSIFACTDKSFKFSYEPNK